MNSQSNRNSVSLMDLRQKMPTSRKSHLPSLSIKNCSVPDKVIPSTASESKKASLLCKNQCKFTSLVMYKCNTRHPQSLGEKREWCCSWLCQYFSITIILSDGSPSGSPYINWCTRGILMDAYAMAVLHWVLLAPKGEHHYGEKLAFSYQDNISQEQDSKFSKCQQTAYQTHIQINSANWTCLLLKMSK